MIYLLQALADPYFQGLANVEREPSTRAISKLEFEFERRKLAKDDVRELIYREVWILLHMVYAKFIIVHQISIILLWIQMKFDIL